jgi:hypothetical protein
MEAKPQSILMEGLLQQRERFSNDEEFRAFALDMVRQFISELRSIDIELTLRPNHYDSSSLSSRRVTSSLVNR